jgi:histidine ammonia-lyase
LRPHSEQIKSAERVRKMLEGSFLWDQNPERQLQDPLSFRAVSQVHGAAFEALAQTEKLLLLHINSSDDNPAVDFETVKVLPSAHFDPTTWGLSLEMVNNALGHVANMSCQRMLKLANPQFTKLPFFLASNEQSIAFGTIQKAFTSLCSEIKTLSQPISQEFTLVAGDVEDHATNAATVSKNTLKILKKLRLILGMELMHAAQGVDLRKRSNPGLKLGGGTQELMTFFRQSVPFLEEDRVLTNDMQQAEKFVQAITNEQVLASLPK